MSHAHVGARPACRRAACRYSTRYPEQDDADDQSTQPCRLTAGTRHLEEAPGPRDRRPTIICGIARRKLPARGAACGLDSGHDVERPSSSEQCHVSRRRAIAFVGRRDRLYQDRRHERSGDRDAPPCAIVGYADLRLGREVRPVLEAHRGGRRRHDRQQAQWHAKIGAQARMATGALSTPIFDSDCRTAPLGLRFDARLYFTQLGELASLAAAFRDDVVLNFGAHRHRPARGAGARCSTPGHRRCARWRSTRMSRSSSAGSACRSMVSD